ncbi:MAG: IS1 family transposase [Candidatus Symbiodolus clandestinus]
MVTTLGTLSNLLKRLQKFTIGRFTTDGWPNYLPLLPKSKQLVGKIFTQRIERHNLTLRTWIKRLARRTICFSKAIEIHEKVMGAYLDKFHHQLI